MFSRNRRLKMTENNPKDLTADQLWNPAMNSVWNKISPFVIGREARGDMPPCKYDELFLQGGRACVDGNTLISTPHGDIKIKDFTGGQIYAVDKNGKIVIAEACAATRYDPQKLFTVKTKSGKKIRCTAEHRFLTRRGWTPCASLHHDDVFLVSKDRSGTSPSVSLRLEKEFFFLARSYYDEHLSESREDAFHLIRTLLSLIYRCSRDFHLCDAQLLSEAESYQDVLQLLTDAREYTLRYSRSDVSEPFGRYIRSFQCEHLPSTLDCICQSEDKHSATSETQIYEMLSELLSEIYPSFRQSQTSEDLAYKIQEAAELLLATKHYVLSHSELLPESYSVQALCDILPRNIDDQTYSISIEMLDNVILDRHNIKWDEVESIEESGEDCFYDIFVPFYNNYFGNGVVNHNSGKSYFASVIVWMSVENDPQKNAVVIRKTGASLRKSCWKQMMKVRERMGLFHWKPNKTELTFTNEITGQQIFFVGLDDEEKVRSITVEKGYISIAWFEEAKQFKDMEEIDQAVSSILRGGAEDDEQDYDDESEGTQEYMTILTYNPPKSQFDWINREARNLKKPNRLTHKSTYLTMPKRWLGKKVLNEIAAMKLTKPKQYQHMYLGMITGTGGEYFRNIVIRKITDEEIANFDYFNMGIDWGYTDPNVFLKTYINDGVMYIFDEVYQDEIPLDGGNKYEEFAKEVYKHTRDCPDDTIWCDAQGKAEASILSGAPYNLEIAFAPKQGANGRKEGYRYMQSLRAIVIDPERCPHAAVEFPMFEAKVAPGGKGWLDEPGTKGDHCCDCARYSENEEIGFGNASSDDES